MSTPTSAAPLALVTGASSGIGAATARHLAGQGYRLLLAARRTDRIRALADELGATAVTCDITRPEDVEGLREAVGEQLDLRVNNAGGAVGQEPLAEADFDAWQTMFQTNVMGTARVTKALLPALEAAAGTVVFVTYHILV